MTRDEAESLLPLINDVEIFGLVKLYAENRIKFLQKSLEQTMDFNEILRIQGQIRELRRFETLRDEILAFKK